MVDEPAPEPGDGQDNTTGTDTACGCLGCGLFLLFDALFALVVLWLLQSCS